MATGNVELNKRKRDIDNLHQMQTSSDGGVDGEEAYSFLEILGTEGISKSGQFEDLSSMLFNTNYNLDPDDQQNIDAQPQAQNASIRADRRDDLDDLAKRKMVSFIEEKYQELDRLNEKIRRLEELKSRRAEVSKDIESMEGQLKEMLSRI